MYLFMKSKGKKIIINSGSLNDLLIILYETYLHVYK